MTLSTIKHIIFHKSQLLFVSGILAFHLFLVSRNYFINFISEGKFTITYSQKHNVDFNIYIYIYIYICVCVCVCVFACVCVCVWLIVWLSFTAYQTLWVI